LKAVPVPQFQSLWSSLVAPIASLFSFDFVIANFASLIDALFALIPAPAAATAIGAPRIGRLGAVGVRSFGAAPLYFPSGIRNTIISAGRSRAMVELTYDGYRRLVEPYKLEYYVRKKDGRGLEYFWGWDTTGGRAVKSVSNNSSATRFNRFTRRRTDFSHVLP
jgi:hypothetical protein